MKDYTAKKLAEIIGAEIPQVDTTVSSVNTDSRRVRSGDCFFAIAGPNFDGHNFVAQAFEKGAACAVVNHDIKLTGTDKKHLLRVDDTVKALGVLAAHYRKQCGFKLIAITGSAGKTTTRRIIAHTLSAVHRTFEAPKNYNNEIGLPLTLLSAEPEAEFVVAEIGANKPGEIATLSRIAAPNIAVVTNIHPAHLEGFGSVDTIIEEKLSIAEGLAPGGTMLLNGDCEKLTAKANSLGIKYKTFGFSKDCGINARNAQWDSKSGIFYIDSTKINTPAGPKSNLENTLAAWAVCKQLSVTAEQFAEAVKDLPPVPMRTEIKHFGAVTVIDDCYNANPGSMKNALELLNQTALAENARPVFICGDMAELGQHSKKLHKDLGKMIAEAGVQLVISVGPLAALAGRTAKETAGYDLNVAEFDNAQAACDNLNKFIKEYDIVLVKGSRSVALEKTVAGLRELFGRSGLTGADKN